MDGPDVGHGMEVARSRVDGASWVEGLRQLIDIVLRALMLKGILEVPRFIEGRPRNDGRMVQVAVDDFGPFRDEVAGVLDLIRVATPAGHFAPREVAKLISPIVEAFLKNFLMETRAIEARRHGKFDIFLERGIRRSGPNSVRIEALVEDKAQVAALVVEHDPTIFDGDFAQAGIGLDGVEDIARGIFDFVCDVIEVWIFGRPLLDNLERDGDCDATDGTNFCRAREVAIGGLDRDRERICRVREEGRCEDELLSIEVRDDAAVFEACAVDGFEPDGLPDAGCARVGATRRFVVDALFAAWLTGAACLVLDADDEVVGRARLHELGEFDREGRAAAKVKADRGAVDINFTFIINAAKVEEDALASPRSWNRELAVIPHRRNEVRIANARELRFWAEGDDNLLGEAFGFEEFASFMLTRLTEVKFVSPAIAIQVDPGRTFKLRAWIFWPRQFCRGEAHRQERRRERGTFCYRLFRHCC